MGFWQRTYLGHVHDQGDGLVHYLYEWDKDQHKNWDTQCGAQWGSWENRSLDLKPKTSKKQVTCVVCIANESKYGTR